MKFKVGDRVRAIAEHDGNKKIIGQVGTVRELYTGDYYGVEFDNDIGGRVPNGKVKPGHFWVIPDSKLEKIDSKFDDKIIITTDGKTTTARYYNGKQLIQSAEAKRSPRDIFDFMTGAKIAMDRLIAMKDEIQVGDRVEIVDGLEKYPIYTDWIIENAPEYALYYAYGCNEDITGCFGKVVAKASHEKFKRMLYLVQLDGKDCYLMGAEGIAKLEE